MAWGKRMVTRLLGILGAAAMTASVSAQAEILASCGSLSGHSYFFEDGSIDAEWTEAEIKSTFIFMKSGDALDVIIKGKDLKGENWTRSASDYRAPVFEVNRVGNVCHILVVWADATELYLLDMDRKVFSLVSQKSGLVPGMHAWVGKCE